MNNSAAFDEKEWSPAVAEVGSRKREEFLMHYVPLVKVLVLRIATRLPRGRDVPDLIGEGSLGLIDAVNRFDPDRGIPFGVYARRRIRGAILDRLRAADPLPRSARDRDDQIKALSGDPQRPKSQEEIAQALGIPVKKLRKGQPAPVIFSLDGAGPDGSGRGWESRMAAGSGTSGCEKEGPLEGLIAREREDLLRRAVATLPGRERQIMSLYYVEELTMKEVGEVLGITESRVCQIHGRALALVRKRVRALTSHKYQGESQRAVL
jgi:RNA polymerase sigma factor for flagellar operon FliA